MARNTDKQVTETLTMASIAQVIDMRKTIKPHVNEVSFVSLAQSAPVSK